MASDLSLHTLRNTRIRPVTSTRPILDASDITYTQSISQLNATGSGSDRPEPMPLDLLTLVTLITNIYQNHSKELIEIQHFNQNPEVFESRGASSDVTRRTLKVLVNSRLERGSVQTKQENVIVKRARMYTGSDEDRYRTLISEIRVRMHDPLRSHPNIADLKGVSWGFDETSTDTPRPRPFFLEEFAGEGSLKRLWNANNLRLTTFEAKVTIMLQIATALQALHACKITHSDIKPDNILIFWGWNAKLTDFGHSIFEYEGRKSLRVHSPPFNAPESARQDLTFDQMVQTDVYSFGLVALCIALGHDRELTQIQDIELVKGNDGMIDTAMRLVRQEDRDAQDSDLDLEVLEFVFENTLQLDSQKRDLGRCIEGLSSRSALRNVSTRRYRGPKMLPFEPLLLRPTVSLIPQRLSNTWPC
jgi:serine/threonine protein kinase